MNVYVQSERDEKMVDERREKERDRMSSSVLYSKKRRRRSDFLFFFFQFVQGSVALPFVMIRSPHTQPTTKPSDIFSFFSLLVFLSLSLSLSLVRTRREKGNLHSLFTRFVVFFYIYILYYIFPFVGSVKG